MTPDTTHSPSPALPRWFLRPGVHAFDRFEAMWNGAASRKFRAGLILMTFVGTLVLILLGRLGWLPDSMVIDKPFGYAIHSAFTLVLVSEVVALVLSLPRSVAESVGRQFELFSLILLRKAFEEFSHRGDGVEWSFHLNGPVMHMIVDIGGAIAVFALIVVYTRLQRHRPITAGEDDQQSFVAAKKGLAVVLLGAFAVIASLSVHRALTGAEPLPLFKTFYVVLVFSDILLVLLAMRYSASEAVVFRNAGFAGCALLLRVALSAPPYFNAGLGVVAAGLLIGVAATYLFATSRSTDQSHPGGAPADE